MTRLLTRIAAAVALFQGFAHGALFLAARPHSIAETAVTAAMWSVRFRLGGALHSYGEMYFGYGLMAASSCLFEAALLWFIAPLAQANPATFRRLAATLLVANLVHGALVLRYFFLVPLVPDTIVALLMVAALISSARRNTSDRP
jgi:hypothetical protein